MAIEINQGWHQIMVIDEKGYQEDIWVYVRK